MAKLCPTCGASMEEEKKFCTQCGGSLAEAPVIETQPAPELQPAPQPAPQAEPQPAPQQTPPPRQTPRPAARPVRQPQYQAQPVYQAQPQMAYGDAPPAPGSKYEPISTGGYIGIMLLMCIPLVGLILMVVWACGGCKKINKRNLARASLVMAMIALVICLILGAAVKSVINKVVDAIEQETGVSFTDVHGRNESGLLGGLLGGGQEGKEQEASGGLGALAGLFSGGQSQSGNSELEELGNLLESLEGLTGQPSGAGDLLDTVEDINNEASQKADGWPGSLRKYPGGTATAAETYRTEISGTTKEEMLAWIEDLKKDGYAYQDFYDFGLSEADMLSMNGWWATDGDIYLSLSFSDGTLIIDHTTELPDLSGLFG